MLDTSRMLPEEKKKIDFEISSGMRDRKTGELLPQFREELTPKTEETQADKTPETTEEPKKKTRKTKE